MKLLLCLSFLLLNISSVYGQKKEYYDQFLRKTTEGSKDVKFYSFEAGEQVHTFFEHRYYYLDGNIYVSSFTKSKFKKQPIEGEYKKYYHSGTIREQGIFVRGLKTGQWFTYFKNGNKSIEYFYNLSEGINKLPKEEIVNVWDIDGTQIVIKGKGYAKFYNEEGELFEKGEVSRRKKNGPWEGYYHNGNKRYIELFKKGNFLKGEFWSIEGEPYTYNEILTRAVPKVGWDQFIKNVKRKIQFPYSFKQTNARGVVRVQFLITKEGEMTNLKIINSLHPDVDIEILRVLKTFEGNTWRPTKYRGKPKDNTYTLPFTFDATYGGADVRIL